jgi:hypothetical protein
MTRRSIVGRTRPNGRSSMRKEAKPSLSLARRSLATAVTALAIAAPVAVAGPADQHAVPNLTAIEAQTLASRGVGAPNPSPANANLYVPPAAAFTDTATRQAKANVYVPPAAAFTDTATRQAKANVYVPPAAALTDTDAPAAPRVQSIDDGFDWGSAGIGAGAVGGLVLIAVGGFGAAYRTRMRVAR